MPFKTATASIYRRQFQCTDHCRLTSIRDYSIHGAIRIRDRFDHDTFVAPIECQQFGHWIRDRAEVYSSCEGRKAECNLADISRWIFKENIKLGIIISLIPKRMSINWEAKTELKLSSGNGKYRRMIIMKMFLLYHHHQVLLFIMKFGGQWAKIYAIHALLF